MRATNRTLLLLLALPPTVPADDGAVHRLGLDVSSPEVTIAPTAGERRFLRLPALEYTFRIDPACAAGYVPHAVSITVADSRGSFGAAELATGGAGHELTLEVPAGQIAPLVIGEFCRSTSEGGVPVEAENEKKMALMQPLTVRAALSAHASLLCVRDATEEITYASAPLDVKLHCTQAAAPPE